MYRLIPKVRRANMKINNQTTIKFITTLKKEHGLALETEEANLALENLVDFFSLLYQYDLDDRRQLSLAKGEKNG